MDERNQIEERGDLALIVDTAIRDWRNRRYACNEEGLVEVKELLSDYIAAAVLANGYRRQSEGEWMLEHETYGEMICSVCGKACPIERKPDPYEDYQMTDFYIMSPFCPNCGARMKGE
jgi:hypothetical protein